MTYSFCQWFNGNIVGIEANALHVSACRSQASSVVDDDVAAKMLEKFKAAKGILVDTARIYGMA